MRTIFITSFHPLISRNILLPLLPHLAVARDVRVVLFVPQKKRNYFAEVFAKENIIVEGIPADLSLAERSLRYLSLAALDTRTLAIKRRTEMRGSGTLLSRVLAGKGLNQASLRHASSWVTPVTALAAIFDAYRPDAIFSTDIQNELDLRLLHAARRRGTATVAMVRSWDNPTSKGLLRFVPDVLVAHNDIVKRELEQLHGVPSERISVIGIPHYDYYGAPISISRNTFFESINGDVSKKTVLFAPIGDRYLRGNTVDREVLEILDDCLPPNVQILVRLPPTDTVSGLERQGREGRIIYDRPANPFKTPKKAEISWGAEAHFKASMYYADLIVAGPSTIVIDGAFFDKPVILVGFDGTQRRPYYESVRRYYDYNHWQPVLASGGVRLVERVEDLKKCAAEYLEHPARDAQGRTRIVSEQAHGTDKRASERLANLLLSML